MANFSNVSVPKVPRSKFNLSHELKTTLDFGTLVPIMCQEVLPGDMFKVNAEVFMRSMPLRSPAMQRCDVFTHFFFVPNRLVWDEWQEFITLGEDGTSAPVVPHILFKDIVEDGLSDVGTLANYMGIPHIEHSVNNNVSISLLPFRAYQLIYNEYYRDQNLIDEVEFEKKGGRYGAYNSLEVFELRRRAWRHDYFTSSLPFAQKGSPVRLAIGDDAPVKHLNPDGSGDFRFYEEYPYDPASPRTRLAVEESGSVSDTYYITTYNEEEGNNAKGYLGIDPQNLYVDLSEANAITVNEFRRAFQLQRFLERNARAGSRYIESIYSQFKVVSSDARLQRPEYLGGGKAPFIISEVLQTSETTENKPLGTMAGRGISVGKSNSFRRYFEEHGFIIGIMSVMPKSSYMQGINRMFTRFEALDYAFPVFAHLGEQEVYNYEIFADTDKPKDVFGYQERYAEYRYHPDVINGDFSGNLSYWHMGRKFGNLPKLNKSFIECKPRKDIFAVIDESVHSLIAQIWFNIKAIRPLPRTGEPGYVDHF